MTDMRTEDLNPRSRDIDSLPTEEIFDIINKEDVLVAGAVERAGESICRAIEDIVSVLGSGGGLIYVGAGTSGRLGVLDASEIPPTFNMPAHKVRAVIAGGEAALTSAIEGAEDDEAKGRDAVSDVSNKDVVIGLSASGVTPFVISALREAKNIGAKCWLLACNDVSYDILDGVIFLDVGPEVVAGSTRMKAGTATKMALNAITTAAMIRLGRVYKGYMVDVSASNAKLIKRAVRIITELTGIGDKEAEKLLTEAGGNAKTAVLMHKKGIGKVDAEAMLAGSNGSLRKALGT